MNLVVEEAVESQLGRVAESGAEHLSVGLLQTHQDADRPRVRQRALHRPATEGPDCLRQINGEYLAVEIGGDLLEFVKTPGSSRPAAPRSRREATPAPAAIPGAPHHPR